MSEPNKPTHQVMIGQDGSWLVMEYGAKTTCGSDLDKPLFPFWYALRFRYPEHAVMYAKDLSKRHRKFAEDIESDLKAAGVSCQAS